jgi:hypothetical protein
VRHDFVGDGQTDPGGDAVPGEVAAQMVMLLGSGLQISPSHFEPPLFERQEPGKECAVGQVGGLLEVGQGVLFVAQGQCPQIIHQGLLVVWREEPLEEPQRQPVFGADFRDGRRGVGRIAS